MFDCPFDSTPMSQKSPLTRFIGLDVHRPYLVACGVDADLNPVLGPERVLYSNLDLWVRRPTQKGDTRVLEMTTNAFQRASALSVPRHKSPRAASSADLNLA